jgi:putative hydrolase of the HAD superfamily
VPIRAVTLDAAGTLLALAEPVGTTYARFAARHGIRVEPADAERAFRAALAAAPPLAFPDADAGTLDERERGWWRAIVARALAAPGGARLDACFDDLFRHYAEAAAWRVFPDVGPALAALRARGIGIGVVSNSDARLVGLLEALGIGSQIDAVVCSARAGAAKPAPAIFLAAVARLGVPAAETLHAGDDPVADVEGARRAGLEAVLVERRGAGGVLAGDVPSVRSLAELPALTGPSR